MSEFHWPEVPQQAGGIGSTVTIIVAALASDGIVLASDSRETLPPTFQGGAPTKRDDQPKLFRAGRFVVGAAGAGAWVLAGPPIGVASVAVVIFLRASGRSGGWSMSPAWETGIACLMLAISAIWLAILLGAWLQRRGSLSSVAAPPLVLPPAETSVQCDRCGESVPRWFAESVGGGIFAAGEMCCFHCTESKPYPVSGESEDDYVSRWNKDGRPRR